ncbi:NAD(P)-binding protein [Clavulina sp. PMI_390]|nr:NAD(P)-binding protein [Clavulina sp. PMI_390]
MAESSSLEEDGITNVIATGMTQGIGLETLKQLVARPQAFRIAIGARNAQNTQIISKLERDIARYTKNPRTTVRFYPLDLARPESVEAFVGQLQSSRAFPTSNEDRFSIDVLLLCAGTTTSQYRTTNVPPSHKRVEETIYVNVLSQARLISLLLPHLASDARISIVNSGLHMTAAKKFPGLSPATLEVELSPPKWASLKAYQISKLIEMHATFIAKDRIEASTAGSHPTILSVRPGFIPTTGLFRNAPWYAKPFLRILGWLPFASSTKIAARVTILAMLDPTIASGSYLSKKGVEPVAPECLDPAVRAIWAEWLDSLGVWRDS